MWTRLDKKLNSSELEMLVHFENVNGTPNTKEYQYNPLNSIAALKVLLNLISQLPKLQQAVVKSIYTDCFQIGEPVPKEGKEEVIGVDSHFNHDILTKQARRDLIGILKDGNVKLDHMVQCLALPNAWSWTWRNDMPDVAKNIPVGWHPMQAHLCSDQQFKEFVKFVKEESIVSIS